jgi:hypothetical protein
MRVGHKVSDHQFIMNCKRVAREHNSYVIPCSALTCAPRTLILQGLGLQGSQWTDRDCTLFRTLFAIALETHHMSHLRWRKGQIERKRTWPRAAPAGDWRAILVNGMATRKPCTIIPRQQAQEQRHHPLKVPLVSCWLWVPGFMHM